MSVLVVGISHNTAPVSVLEQVALDGEATIKLIDELHHCEDISEATVLATCNRVEVYAAVDRFHGSVEAITRTLCERAGQQLDTLLPHFYVHYDDGAVSHLFHVTSGLDSMVVGESQILGQAREALRIGQEAGSVGGSLNSLFQQALRVGKRSHAETDIDRAGPSLVSSALTRAEEHVGDLSGLKVLLVGAGSMAGLAAATVSRAGVGELLIANRTPAHAERLAEMYAGRVVDLTDVIEDLTDVDVVISCTGATGVVLDLDTVAAARAGATKPMAILDLALPHDVDPGIADLHGVELIGLGTLADELHAEDQDQTRDVAAVRAIVAEELTSFIGARRAAAVTPTVVALRTMATGVVDAEIARLSGRLPGLDEESRVEIERSIRRVADKLLHQPTVRVKELADSQGAVSYAAALAELFALDPDAVEAVTRVEGL